MIQKPSVINWHKLSTKEVLKELNTTKKGLLLEEVEKRREKYGSNVIKSSFTYSWLKIILSQFRSSLVIILLIASLISLYLGEIVESLVILAIVFINAAIGFFQERKAKDIMLKLKKSSRVKVKVKRYGEDVLIDSGQLVLGDILKVSRGDKVTCDARVLEMEGLKMDESILTGESGAVEKNNKKIDGKVPFWDQKNMIYCGSSVLEGEAVAVVTGVGEDTEFARIAYQVSEIEEETPLQGKIKKLSIFLAIVIGIITTVIFFFGILQKKDPLEMLNIAVAVAVASIPEGLVISMSIALASGALKILKKKGLVKRLAATETLGGVSVICTDKTGTLTKGKLTLTRLIVFRNNNICKANLEEELKKEERLLLESAFYDSRVARVREESDGKEKILGDPIEKAIFSAAELNKIDKDFTRVFSLDFDEKRAYSASFIKKGMDKHLILKGAPEKFINSLDKIQNGDREENFAEKRKKLWQEELNQLAKKGYRVIALGKIINPRREEELKGLFERNDIFEILRNEIVFLGFLVFEDPIRISSKHYVETCKKNGIRVVMITGDHMITAKTVGEKAGLRSRRENVTSGEELERLNSVDFEKKLDQADIFARVSPFNKIKIIEGFIKKGDIVAMTGDGINDAPALKRAHCGIALGSGTDITKEAADIVLLNDNFKTIIEAIKQGRIVFNNIKRVITYLLSDSFAEMILIGGSLLFGLPLPLLASQILWVNLIEDGLPAMALAVAGSKENGKFPKKASQKGLGSLIDKEVKFIILVVGIVTDLILLSVFYLLWRRISDIDHVRTFIFVALAIDSIFYVYCVKSLGESVFNRNIFDNKFLNIAVLISLILIIFPVYVPFLQNILHTVPLGFNDWVLLVFLGVLEISFIEIAKYLFRDKLV